MWRSRLGKKNDQKKPKLKLVAKKCWVWYNVWLTQGWGGRWKNAAHPINRMTTCGIMLVNTGSGGGWKNAAYPMDRTTNRWVRVHSGPRWVWVKGWYPPNNTGLEQHGNMNSCCHYKIITLFCDIKIRVLCLETQESKSNSGNWPFTIIICTH